MKPAKNDFGKRRHLFGIGLDGKDGHKRISKGDDFSLVGGSEETHDHMLEKSIKLSEKLKKTGKTIADASNEEFVNTARELGFRFPDSPSS